MKLASISEDAPVARTERIRVAGESLGKLLEFAKTSAAKREYKTLIKFMQSPSAHAWDQTKWVLDSLSQQAAKLPDPASQLKEWIGLKQLTSPVVASAVFDIDQSYLNGTPLRQMAMSRPVRNKIKSALGPQGWVSALSKADELPRNKLKTMLKDTARSSTALNKAIKTDIPGVKPITKF